MAIWESLGKNSENDVIMRKILILTGSRSEYDILSSTMLAIKRHPLLKLQVVVTGAHLSEKFGYTYKEIENDGFKIDQKIESMLSGDKLVSRAKSVGIQIMGLASAFEQLKPDMVLVAGDREEVVSAAIAATYLNLPIAHMCGGDTAFGSVDNQVRDATTKLSHLHFPMLSSHAERIIAMGEEGYRVHVVGHGGLDRIISTPPLSKKQLSKQLGFDFEDGPVILMIQHVLSSEIQEAEIQISCTFSALLELGYKVIVGYPNSDTGSEVIINTIKSYCSKLNSYIYKNLPSKQFINLLRHVDVLIGNSSCGIIEGPLLKLPVINIGNRQKNRTTSTNVIFVNHNKDNIKAAIRTALFDNDFKTRVEQCQSIYGDGHTGEKIADILSKVSIAEKLLNKPNL